MSDAILPTAADLERDLRADLELCQQATPGPWRRHDTIIGDSYHAATEVRGNDIVMSGKVVGSTPVCKLHSGFVWFEGDCDFIPDSREGWPAAIRRAIAAEAELRRVDSLLVHRDNAIVTRLEAVKKFLAASGHDLCHENRRELAHAFGLEATWPSLPPEQEYAERCIQHRQSLYGHNGPGSDAEVYEAKIKELEAENARLREALKPLAEAHYRDELGFDTWVVMRHEIERAKELLAELKKE